MSTNIIEELSQQVAKACRGMYEKDMVFAAGGNISACDQDEGVIVITPTGSSLRNIEPEDLVAVNMEGEVLHDSGNPSKEVHQHANLFKLDRDISAVIHVHPPNVVAVSIAQDQFPLVTEPSKVKVGEIPILDNKPAGSPELAEETRDAFRDPDINAVIIRSHALVTVGSSMKSAWDTAELAEESARVYLGARTLKSQVEDFSYNN